MTNSLFPYSLPCKTDSRIVFDKEGKQIRKDSYKRDSDVTYEYYSFVTSPYSAMILAQTKNGKFVINREYRHSSNEIILSLPGGSIDTDEDSLLGAKRELLEETGYQGEDFSLLGDAYPFPGYSPQKTYYYLCHNAEKIQDSTPDRCEIIHTFHVTIPEIYSFIKEGMAVDGHIHSALFLKSLQEGQ